MRQRKQDARENSFYDMQKLLMMELYLKIFTEINSHIEIVIANYKEFLLDYLLKSYGIFEVSNYPQRDFDYLKLIENIEDIYTVNDRKREYFSMFVKNNPCFAKLYIAGLENIEFSYDEIKDILLLINKFSLTDEVIDGLEENGSTDIIKLFKQPNDIEKIIDEINIEHRTYSGILFDTITDKERYLSEDSRFRQIFTEMNQFCEWYDLELLSQNKSELQIQTPYEDRLLQEYNSILQLYDDIYNELNNSKFFIETKELIAIVYQFISKRKIQDIYNLQLPQIKEQLHDKEIVFAYITTTDGYLALSSRGLLSIRTQYDSKKCEVDRFIVDDIILFKIDSDNEKVYYQIETEKIKIHFDLGGTREKYEELNKCINSILDNNTSIKQRRIKNAVKNINSRDLLSVNNERLELIAKADYLIHESLKNTPNIDYYIGKWSYEILMNNGNEWPELIISVLDKLKMRLEYVFFFDELCLITDKNIYVFDYQLEKKAINYDVYDVYDVGVKSR